MRFLESFVFWYPAIMSTVWIVGALLFLERIELKKPLPLTKTPMVSILIACHNESSTIEHTLENLKDLDYPNYEIIAIDDGSTDNTFEVLTQLLDKYSHLRIVKMKHNSGKANALYHGLLVSKGEVLVGVDADSYLEKDALLYMVPHFTNTNSGERVGAVTGNPRVRNRSSLLSKIQLCEYASIISLTKRTQRILGKVMTVSGVCVAYRKRALLDCHLWDRDLLTEDVAITWKLEKAELKVKEYLGLLLPQVNADLSFTHFGKLPSSIIPSNTFPGQTEDLVTTFGTPNNVSANINLSQIIFNGSFLIGVKGAQEYVELSKKELALNDEQIIDQVIRAFYAVLVTRENLEIITQNKTNLEKLIFETEQYYKNGFVEQLDVDRLKLSLTNLNTTIKGIELQVKLTETLLKYQMGMPLDEPIIVIGKLDDFLTNITIGIDSIADFSNRGDVNLMNARVNLQKTNIKRLKYEYLPSLVGFATIGSQALRQKFDFFNFNEPWLNQRFFGVQLNVPIWDSYSRKRTIQGVQVGIKQIEMTREIMLDGYEIQFENAKTELITAYDAYISYESNIQLAEKIYKTTQVKYKEGIGSSLELKSAESELYTTQSNYINAIYRVLIAKQEINKLLGIL